MILHKHFEILDLFRGDYNRQIHGRLLIGKVKQSQKQIALTLKEMERQHILNSKKTGNMVLYHLNLNNPHIKDYLTITEIVKKIQFLKKNLNILHMFEDSFQMAGIFGSFSSGTHKKHSDIDIFTIGKPVFQKRHYGPELHIQSFSQEEFIQMLQNKEPLTAEIVKNHIMLSHEQEWVWMVWEAYYGLHKMVLGSRKRHFTSAPQPKKVRKVL